MRTAIVLAVLAVIAIGAALAFHYGAGRLDGAVAATVERYGAALTGTAVDVDGVELALTDGRAELAGITIDNPAGYETAYAVRIEQASVALDIGSLTGDVPVIDELTLHGASINAEQREAASNLTDIEHHATASPGDSAPSANPGKIVVKRFRLEDARVLVTSEYLGKPEELPLRDVVVENIGVATGGATYSQAAEAMLTPVLAAARAAAAERLKSRAGEAASDAVREKLDEQADKARERISERVDELRDRG